MLLQLVYSENHQAPVTAAVIRGGNVYDWLTEIGSWDVDLRALQCFILPQSIGANNAGGLFIIFQHEAIAAKLTLQSPYTQIAPGFFIPVHAALTPAVTATELTAIKLWDIQVFHPSIGLTGFEQKDELKLIDFIETPEEQTERWLPAYPQVQIYPRLNSIRLEQEDAPFDPNSLFEQLPLDGIPDPDKEQHTLLKRIMRALGTIGLWLLLVLAAIGKIIFAILRALVENRSGRRVVSPKKGWLKKFEDWINKRLKDLQKQRDSELNRLVKLFDKDTDDALKYAIPLNSPYLNRGTAPPSGKLTRRPLNMNFRNFGGGGKADYWDLGEYRMTLRQQYMKALNAAIDRGDYKKAAYIYAHLLGDLRMAAQTLQDGKHYREAAAIYKDHLDNKGKAAECLEKGGLISEAIPIYVDSGNYEKAGDLHVVLGQEKQATKYYNDTVKRSLDAKDYLNAARLKTEKMGEKAMGQVILLSGWKDDNKPEQCLAKYFENSSDETLHNEVKDVYERHVSLRRKTAFLKVLADLLPKNKDERLSETAIEISYQVVHQQVSRGDYSGLKLLNKFMPGDRLLAQDAGRYILQNQQKTPVTQAVSYLTLRPDTKWTSIVNYHDQLIGVGVKNKELYLFRANWDGKIVYEFLFLSTGLHPFFWLTADGQLSSQVLLTGNAVSLALNRKMDAFSYFEKGFNFHQLNWQLPDTLCYGLRPHIDDAIFILHNAGGHLCLDEFSHEGSLLKSTYLLEGEEKVGADVLPFLHYSEMYFRKDHFYFTGPDRLMRVDANGQLDFLQLTTNILAFSISGPYAALKVALLTAEGCIIVTPELKGMKFSTPMFGDELTARFVQLLPDNRVVIANEELAVVYDISDATPRLIGEFESENSISRILSVPKRNHFALLENDNRISIHNLGEEA